MKIVVDVDHPKDVHLFKNFIKIMKNRGHDILITASEKEVSIKLLDAYKFEYIYLGNYGESLIKKAINIPKLDYRLYKAVKKFNPDIFIGLGPIRASHVAYLMGKPSISFEDTEHSKEQHILYVPFITKILTPSCFKKDFGKKQIRYNGYYELAYLHPNYFKPDPEILKEIGLRKDSTFIILRFVSWNASHDIGHHGIQNKIDFVKELEKYGCVLITSEGRLDNTLEQYRIKVSPEKLHHLLYYASLYVGDGGTTAVESAILGTPSIYVSSLVGTMGNFIELEETYGLLLNHNNSDIALKKAIELLKNPDIKEDWGKKREQLLKDKIDVTAFMVQFVEQYK